MGRKVGLREKNRRINRRAGGLPSQGNPVGSSNISCSTSATGVSPTQASLTPNISIRDSLDPQLSTQNIVSSDTC